MGIGFAIYVVAGASSGIYAKNQMAATSVAMPVMLILAFLPMIAMFNDKIEKVAKILEEQAENKKMEQALNRFKREK